MLFSKKKTLFQDTKCKKLPKKCDLHNNYFFSPKTLTFKKKFGIFKRVIFCLTFSI